MPRKRVLDPKIWTDDKFIELNSDEKLLFIGMMNHADDRGIHKNNPKVLKIEIFPADPDIDFNYVEDMVKKLLHVELLLISEDKKLLRYVNWDTYQKIQHKTPSKYEDEDGNIIITFIYNYNNGTIKEPCNNNNDTISLSPNIIEYNIIESNIKESNVAKSSKKNPEKQVKQDFTFEHVYSIYPIKKSKQASMKAFSRIPKKTMKDFIKGLEAHIKHWEEEGVDKQFIPHLSTFINQRRWEDEIVPSIAGKPKFKDEMDKQIYERNENMVKETKRMTAYLKHADEVACDDIPDLNELRGKSNAQPISEAVGQFMAKAQSDTSSDGE